MTHRQTHCNSKLRRVATVMEFDESTFDLQDIAAHGIVVSGVVKIVAHSIILS